MASDTGDRQSESAADTQGTADAGVTGQQDIFDQIARNIFVKRDIPADDRWIALIAEEFRIAMTELDVQVKPKGPKPKATRTKNGTLLMLIGALENGDLWIRDCLVPMKQQPDGSMTVVTGTVVTFDVGHFSIEARFTWNADHTVILREITAVVMATGERFTTAHPTRSWLAHYRPSIELDTFSPILQHTLDQLPPGSPQWSVIGEDAEGRVWKWPNARDPQLWKDARGREL